MKHHLSLFVLCLCIYCNHFFLPRPVTLSIKAPTTTSSSSVSGKTDELFYCKRNSDGLMYTRKYNTYINKDNPNTNRDTLSLVDVTEFVESNKKSVTFSSAPSRPRRRVPC